MRYTKPTVLTTVNANAAIQVMGNHGDGKSNPQISDHTKGDELRSTTGAYDAEQ